MDLSAVSSVVQTIGGLLTEEVTSLLGVEEQVEFLQRELKWMQGFLKEADARKADNEVIRTSVAEIRELAYDAEDVIETFALKVASRRKGGILNIIKRSACILQEGWLLCQTKSEIEKITARIKELTRQLKTYDVTRLGDGGKGSSSSNDRRELRRSYSHIIEDNIVGLDNDIKTLVSVLVDEENECRVVSICGMGGLGKTTLAKKVYHHHQVKKQFNHLSWVYVSQQCQRKNVWEGILSGFNIMDREDREKRDEELAKKLFEFMKDRKCLVMLDDIWSTEAWDRVKPAFPESETRSKILLTSRNKEIVSYADRRGYLYELQCLKEKESLELLKKIAFRGRDSTDIARIEELGKDMVKQCAGLPLAVVVLGGILATKNSLTEWEIVFKNVKSHMKRGKSQGPEDVLALSYNDLPPYLRPCFLYLSHFPEDYQIHAQRLIQLWAAEGIVSSMHERDGGETTEDVAESYLIELAERCMIQVRQRDVATLKIETFQMHDLMRDLCLSKAKQENFLFIVDQSNVNSLSNIRGVLRVSAHQPFWIQHIKSSNIRSLLLFNDDFTQKGTWTYMMHNFKLLRVLDVEEESEGEEWELPSDIGKLIHLRFLSIKMKKLPSSLGNLRCLRTLDLRALWVDVHVPDVIWRMEQLRHLYLPKYCDYKTKLKLGTLRNLQTLVNFNTKYCYVEDLINMSNITELAIRGPFNMVSRNGRMDPGHLTHLWSCVITCKLSIDVKISKLPEQHYFSSNMAYIQLRWCRLEEDPMPSLEKLPNLRILEFGAEAFIGKEMVCSAEGFPKLESLSLCLLFKLEEWKVDEGAMPALRHLEIVDCWPLKMLPDGLRFITTLQELKIETMPMEFKDKVVEGGADYYKVQHVPSIIFQLCDGW